MRKTILIVDDSLFMRTYLKNYIDDKRFQVVSEACNGEEAIMKYKEYVPDIVILDITMPNLNGIQALKAIKKFDSSATVVMCSALGQNSVIIEALKNGAKDFIVKPNFNNLVTILNNIEYDWSPTRLTVK